MNFFSYVTEYCYVILDCKNHDGCFEFELGYVAVSDGILFD